MSATHALNFLDDRDAVYSYGEQFPVWCAGPKGLFVWDRGNGRHEGEVSDILKNLGRK